MDKIEEEGEDCAVKEEELHIKMGLTSQTSPVNFKMQSGTHSQTRQEKG